LFDLIQPVVRVCRVGCLSGMELLPPCLGPGAEPLTRRPGRFGQCRDPKRPSPPNPEPSQTDALPLHAR
jgi:hypothetical protein